MDQEEIKNLDPALQEDDLEEIFNLDPAVLEQLLDQLLEEEEGQLQHNLVDVDNQTIDEAIQNLPPEIREIIYKEYVAIKLRDRAVLGWNKVNEGILKLPFCDFMQQIVPTVICMEYQDCHFEGCCYPCWISVDGRPPLHKVSMNPPMETIPLI